MWMGKRNEYKILVGKCVGKWPLGRPTNRWEDIINTELRKQDLRYGKVFMPRFITVLPYYRTLHQMKFLCLNI
jgi:hypothetical protein